jgi:hypothetical protein
VSSRRSASVVIALAVASLAVTSMGAMVASSELLVEAVDRPARRLDPLVLDLGSVGTIQAELPKDARPARPPARRPPAADPPPPRRRQPTAVPPAADREEGGGRLVVVAHIQVVKRIVVRKPVFRPPPLPPPLPPDVWPRTHWPRRRWVAHPRHHRHHHHHHRRCGGRRWRWKDHDDRHRWTGERSATRRGRRGRPDPPRSSTSR